MQSEVLSKIKEKLDQIIEKALKKRVFTGCSVGFFYHEKKQTKEKCFTYGFTETKKAYKISKKSFFDLASLTKPLVTSLSIIKLVQMGKIRFEDPLNKFFPNISSKKINIINLLNHSSGFPAHRSYAEKLLNFSPKKRNRKLIEWILSEKLEYVPGSRSVYSDLGYMLLGEVIERVSGSKLDVFWEETISRPLGLYDCLFFKGNDVLDSRDYVETGICSWTNRRLCGLVNDDNCRALHGIAGHAGLFGNVGGLLGLLKYLLREYRKSGFPAVKSNYFLKDSRIKQGCWYYGFDTPLPGMSSSGKFFSEQTVGHLGFTGASFWLDFKNEICIVLLTNRAIYGEQNSEIKKIRPQIHDIIMKNITIPS